jgi:DNA-binding helix-hairpin-helix protein with protein kinase domain
MKEHKRKYSFETEVRVPGIEEIVRVATNFTEGGKSDNKPEPKINKSGIPSGEPKLDKKMSSMRNQMMKLAEAVAEDDQAVLKQIIETKEEKEIEEEKELIEENEIKEQELTVVENDVAEDEDPKAKEEDPTD